MYDWEISASKAQKISSAAPTQKLIAVKKTIMGEINKRAVDGKHTVLIFTKDYDVFYFEDWNNIYNWLLSLGYKIKHNNIPHDTAYTTFIIEW